jgi:hypothetical protein
MTKGEVRNLIYEGLTPVAAPADFRLNKKAEGFIRKIEGGRQTLAVPLWDYNPVFEFSLTMCLRLELVEEIVNRFSGSPPAYHAMTLTSITQLEFLGLAAEPGRGVVYRATSERELAEVLASVSTLIRQRVLPFFDKYHDLMAVNHGLNPEGAENVFQPVWPPNPHAFDTTNEPYRAMAGVAIAHLVGDPRLKELVAAYRGQISGLPDHDRRKFEEMVVHLLGHGDTG